MKCYYLFIEDFNSGVIVTCKYIMDRGERLNMSSLEDWMKKNRAPALGETLRFFNEIRGRGFKVFLISSRRETLRTHTADNLIKVGYHGWTALILRYTIYLSLSLQLIKHIFWSYFKIL